MTEHIKATSQAHGLRYPFDEKPQLGEPIEVADGVFAAIGKCEKRRLRFAPGGIGSIFRLGEQELGGAHGVAVGRRRFLFVLLT